MCQYAMLNNCNWKWSFNLYVLTAYRARACANPGRPCDSFNQLVNKLVTRLVASWKELPAKEAQRRMAYLYEVYTDNLES